MPIHAKVLTAMLAINAALAIVPLMQSTDTMTIVRAVIPALLLYGFLRGSEGVRVLLLIGATLGLLFGGFALLSAAALLASGGYGVLLLGTVVWAVIANGYMLYALRDIDVQHWMMRRSLGLDDVEPS